jgi:ABC-type amino acid transport substrate-binding protein
MTAELKDQFDFSEAYHDKPELAIPFQKGNPAFKTSLDGALKRVKDDGRLKALSQKWFEDQAPADAPTPEPTQATPAH